GGDPRQAGGVHRPDAEQGRDGDPGQGAGQCRAGADRQAVREVEDDEHDHRRADQGDATPEPPARSAGSMNLPTTTAARPRPARASSPRTRATTATTRTKPAASSPSGKERSMPTHPKTGSPPSGWGIWA